MANAVALVAFGRSVRKAFGVNAGIWYALLQASQFHVMYYASRTLPNMYATIFSKWSIYLGDCFLTRSCQARWPSKLS